MHCIPPPLLPCDTDEGEYASVSSGLCLSCVGHRSFHNGGTNVVIRLEQRGAAVRTQCLSAHRSERDTKARVHSTCLP